MIIKAKTIEEALKKAEDQTGRRVNELIYEVTDKKKSFFRGGEVEIEIKGFKALGTVKVENEIVLSKDGEILPSIEPGKNINLYVNDRIIAQKTNIKETDVVKIELLNTQAERHLNISFSEDKMEAFAEILYTPQRTYSIRDLEEVNHAIIEGELKDEKFPPLYTKGELEAALTENKVRFGIQWENFDLILKGGKGLVAKGVKPIQATDDKIEYFFDTKIEKKPLEIQGKVDYYNIGEVDFVEEGKFLALRHIGTDGKPGFDVFGNHIYPPKRLILKIGKGSGCEVVDNGNKAISLLKGMPSIKGERVCVFPAHVIQGDVDLKTANINFEGDVVIKGSVREGLSVKAGNNIRIYGDALNAEIISGGNVCIDKSIIGSTIKAGSHQLLTEEAINLLKSIENFLESLLKSINIVFQAKQISTSHSTAQLIKVLLESKFQYIKPKILEGFNFMRNSKELDSTFKNIWDEFFKIYRDMLSGNLNSLDILRNQTKTISDFLMKCEVNNFPADVIINNTQNSVIIATNNVEVRGKGCYNTVITANGEVRFTGVPGVLRGGEITAAKGIHIRECGSSAGVKSILKTSKSGVIEIQTAYQNTLLCFEELMYKLEFPAKNLKAHVNKGEIIVEKLKL